MSSLNPARISLTCSSIFTLFLSASLSLLSILSFASAFPLFLYFLPVFFVHWGLLLLPWAPTLLYGLYLLVSSCILPYFVDYASPPYSSSPFRCFLPWRPYQLWLAASFLGMLLTLVLCIPISTFLRLYLLSGYNPSSALNTVFSRRTMCGWGGIGCMLIYRVGSPRRCMRTVFCSWYPNVFLNLFLCFWHLSLCKDVVSAAGS